MFASSRFHDFPEFIRQGVFICRKRIANDGDIGRVSVEKSIIKWIELRCVDRQQSQPQMELPPRIVVAFSERLAKQWIEPSAVRTHFWHNRGDFVCLRVKKMVMQCLGPEPSLCFVDSPAADHQNNQGHRGSSRIIPSRRGHHFLLSVGPFALRCQPTELPPLNERRKLWRFGARTPEMGLILENQLNPTAECFFLLLGQPFSKRRNEIIMC